MRSILTCLLMALGFGAGACGDDAGDDPAADFGVDAAQPDFGVADTGIDQGGLDAGIDMGPIGCVGPDCGIVEVAAGGEFSCARRGNGEVLCWGANLFGQLGDGSTRHGAACGTTGVEPRDCSAEPVEVLDLVAVEINASGPGSCALVEDGTLWCWGLADVADENGERRRLRTPEMRDFGSVSHFDKSSSHTCALQNGGQLICAGRNESGQLGDGTFEDRPITAPVVGVSGVVEVAAGGGFTCARTATSVLCWGDNVGGQLGDDATHATCGNGDTTWDCSASPVEVMIDGASVAQLALGADHACARMNDGAVMCWGFNAAGQVGGAPGPDVRIPRAVEGVQNATEISVDRDTSCALVEGGDVLCWGDNDEGQLGDGVEVGDHGSCSARGSVTDCTGDPVEVVLPEPATQLDVGSHHACVLSATQKVYCWGYNDQRQLGPEGASNRSRSTLPVEVTGLE